MALIKESNESIPTQRGNGAENFHGRQSEVPF
jgi:hypothetical protein